MQSPKDPWTEHTWWQNIKIQEKFCSLTSSFQAMTTNLGHDKCPFVTALHDLGNKGDTQRSQQIVFHEKSIHLSEVCPSLNWGDYKTIEKKNHRPIYS